MKQVLFSELGGYGLTSVENFEARVQNAYNILHFKKENGFDTVEKVKEYLKKYGFDAEIIEKI